MDAENIKSKKQFPYSLSKDVAGRKILFVNYYMLGNPGKGNPWVLVDGGLPGSAKTILKEVEDQFGVDNPPQAILLTHGHFDHVGALPDLLKVWGDVKIYAHPLELPYLTGKSSYPPPDPLAGGGGMAYMSWAFPSTPYNFGDLIEALPVDGSIPFLPDWRYIHTPGHAPGHISLFREKDRILIAGDAFTTTNQNSVTSVLTQKKEMHGPPAYFTINWQESLSSIQHLKSLDPEIAGTGHGLPAFGDELKEGLADLERTFLQNEIPKNGRYTDNPALTNLQGVLKMPKPTSYKVALVLAGIAGAASIAGIGYLIGKNFKKKK